MQYSSYGNSSKNQLLFICRIPALINLEAAQGLQVFTVSASKNNIGLQVIRIAVMWLSHVYYTIRLIEYEVTSNRFSITR